MPLVLPSCLNTFFGARYDYGDEWAWHTGSLLFDLRLENILLTLEGNLDKVHGGDAV